MTLTMNQPKRLRIIDLQGILTQIEKENTLDTKGSQVEGLVKKTEEALITINGGKTGIERSQKIIQSMVQEGTTNLNSPPLDPSRNPLNRGNLGRLKNHHTPRTKPYKNQSLGYPNFFRNYSVLNSNGITLLLEFCDGWMCLKS